MRLTSPAFFSGERVPIRFTCDGPNSSPPLVWSAPPDEAKSLALVCSDADAPGGTWYHWAIYDIPTAMRALDEHWPATRATPPQAINDFRRRGYGGPCPPRGAPAHRYLFRLYALNIERLAVGANAQCRQVEALAKTYTIATTELIGLYGRI
jgi:Raf kinase inhibitor-like YbhB/YbcL family protein